MLFLLLGLLVLSAGCKKSNSESSATRFLGSYKVNGEIDFSGIQVWYDTLQGGSIVQHPFDTTIVHIYTDSVINVTALDDTTINILDDQYRYVSFTGNTCQFKVINYNYAHGNVSFFISNPDSIYINYVFPVGMAHTQTTILKGRKL